MEEASFGGSERSSRLYSFELTVNVAVVMQENIGIRAYMVDSFLRYCENELENAKKDSTVDIGYVNQLSRRIGKYRPIRETLIQKSPGTIREM
jgi:hypothetical protein